MKRLVLWVMAYALAILSAAWAARYGVKLSEEWVDVLIRGGGLAAIAIVAVHGLAWATRAWDSGSKFVACFTAGTGIVCFLVAIAGGVGNLAMTEDAKIGARNERIAGAADDAADRQRLLAERAALPRHRPADAVAPLLETAKAHQRYVTSRSCDPAFITLQETREHCALFREIEAELATARRAAAIDAALAKLRRGSATVSTNAGKDANPHGAWLSRIVWGWVDAQTASAWFAMGVSIALELAGMATMLTAEATTRDRQSSAKQPGKVARFFADRLVQEPDAETQVGPLYPIYVAWCDGRGLVAIDAAAFRAEVARICQQTDIGTKVDGADLVMLDVTVPA